MALSSVGRRNKLRYLAGEGAIRWVALVYVDVEHLVISLE